MIAKSHVNHHNFSHNTEEIAHDQKNVIWYELFAKRILIVLVNYWDFNLDQK